MKEERLAALCLMYINKGKHIDPEEIVLEFARRHPRKMELPNILDSDSDR